MCGQLNFAIKKVKKGTFNNRYSPIVKGAHKMKDKILQLLKNSNVFLTGGAGVGKSYLTKEIIAHYKKHSKQIVVLGSTGISAVGIGGQTIHSFFGFGICSSLEELMVQDRKNRKKIKDIKKILEKCTLIVIDEISMVGSNLLDMIRYRIQKSMFEGSFLFVGDFFQLPPVIKKSNSLFNQSMYAFDSMAWNFFDPIKVELFDMKRTRDKRFFKILGKIRVGLIDSEVESYLLELSVNNEILQYEPTFLYGKNYEATITNIKKLSNHPKKEICLKADLSLHQKKLSNKKIKSWINSLPVEEELRLKVGVPVLFTSNKRGKFFNGERGIVKEITDDSLLVEKNGKDIRVQRQDFDLFEYKSDKNGEIKESSLATISQYPIKLAYAITIHKSQGMSIESLVCNIDNIFTRSQFYVGIARAIDPQKLYIEYKKRDIKEYLQKIITVSDRVKEFYLLS